MKKAKEKDHNKISEENLPPEVSPTVTSEINSSLEAMKDSHKEQEKITKEAWIEKKDEVEKKERSMYKEFQKKMVKGEGPNPVLKKGKSIGGVRGRFHPSKKGKH